MWQRKISVRLKKFSGNRMIYLFSWLESWKTGKTKNVRGQKGPLITEVDINTEESCTETFSIEYKWKKMLVIKEKKHDLEKVGPW